MNIPGTFSIPQVKVIGYTANRFKDVRLSNQPKCNSHNIRYNSPEPYA